MDEHTGDPCTHENTDPVGVPAEPIGVAAEPIGVAADPLVKRLLDMVEEQMEQQSKTMWRFMVLFVLLMLINASLSGAGLAVNVFGLTFDSTDAPVAPPPDAAEPFVGPVLEASPEVLPDVSLPEEGPP